jgi:hypothetical protein
VEQQLFQEKLIMGEVTYVTVTSGDITNVTISESDITALSVQSSEITTILAAPATIVLGGEPFLSGGDPADIARAASSGVSTLFSRSDHVHSIANTLLDGGNY